MQATFTLERLPHIPRLSSPPPRGRPASRGAPPRSTAREASPRTATAAATTSPPRGSTPAAGRGSLTSPSARATARGGAASALKTEPKRRPSSVSGGAPPPQENASAYSTGLEPVTSRLTAERSAESDDDDAFVGLAETEHERAFGQHVQRRMQIMPLVHCKAPNGEAMSINMPKCVALCSTVWLCGARAARPSLCLVRVARGMPPRGGKRSRSHGVPFVSGSPTGPIHTWPCDGLP